ncbi:MAG: GPW/gp25 family protein [Rubrivivax sp.]|nr:GPW/gp25 family protein [Rubrivivax sp.]
MSHFLPCLLERWERWAGTGSPLSLKSDWPDVRRDVVRNLEWLLNSEATDWLGGYSDGYDSDGRPSQNRRPLPPEVALSVLTFGVPPYAGRTQSSMSPEVIARDLTDRILAFEPRIHAESLEVHPVVEERRNRFNLLQFSVQGHLRANPLMAFEVVTELDLETGQARVID